MKGVTKGEGEKVEERNNSDNSAGFISHATVDLNDAQHWKIKTREEGEGNGHRCQMRLSLSHVGSWRTWHDVSRCRDQEDRMNFEL